MTAYVIVDVEVHNPEAYKEYLAKITPTVYENGGTYLVRGADTQVVTGKWQPKRMVVMQFPSLKVAQYWATSDTYADIHALRNANADANMVIVEGSVDFK
ncbi:DUF1330 domain-containing protein [Paraglaciecola sp.]|uniref:DUF1330 domain-containing protein n=1 Tax=Paraglaciecola sp. TaxID=1920173 RepID=UPI003EF73710